MEPERVFGAGGERAAPRAAGTGRLRAGPAARRPQAPGERGERRVRAFAPPRTEDEGGGRDRGARGEGEAADFREARELGRRRRRARRE